MYLDDGISGSMTFFVSYACRIPLENTLVPKRCKKGNRTFLWHIEVQDTFEKQIPALAFLQSKNISTLQSDRISKFFIFFQFAPYLVHLYPVHWEGIKDSPQDVTIFRSCSHSFPSPSINRSITSFSGLIVGVGDGDGVTEGVGVEDGIGVTEGVGVSVGVVFLQCRRPAAGVVWSSSDAITFSNQKLPAKYFLYQLCTNLLP